MPFITQVLLPLRDNLGRSFGREQYRAFHEWLIRRFGGWTRKGEAEGAWLGPSGEIFVDQHWIYEVGHARRDLRFWQAEKERLKTEFDQKRSGSFNMRDAVSDSSIDEESCSWPCCRLLR
jgi:hypothetical protein